MVTPQAALAITTVQLVNPTQVVTPMLGRSVLAQTRSQQRRGKFLLILGHAPWKLVCYQNMLSGLPPPEETELPNVVDFVANSSSSSTTSRMPHTAQDKNTWFSKTIEFVRNNRASQRYRTMLPKAAYAAPNGSR